MLRDDLLRRRFHEYLERIERLADKETTRLRDDERFRPIAQFYVEHLVEVRRTWDRIRGDVVGALVGHADDQEIDLISCSATHAYLPGLLATRRALRAQLRVGMRAFEHLTGRRPQGIWLPECAYSPEFDAEIAQAGFRYTVLDSHGVSFARPRPPFGVTRRLRRTPGSSSSRAIRNRAAGVVAARRLPGRRLLPRFLPRRRVRSSRGDLGDEVGPFGAHR